MHVGEAMVARGEHEVVSRGRGGEGLTGVEPPTARQGGVREEEGGGLELIVCGGLGRQEGAEVAFSGRALAAHQDGGGAADGRTGTDGAGERGVHAVEGRKGGDVDGGQVELDSEDDCRGGLGKRLCRGCERVHRKNKGGHALCPEGEAGEAGWTRLSGEEGRLGEYEGRIGKRGLVGVGGVVEGGGVEGVRAGLGCRSGCPVGGEGGETARVRGRDGADGTGVVVGAVVPGAVEGELREGGGAAGGEGPGGC